MEKRFPLLPVILVVALLFSQCINRKNKQGQRVGRWREYADSAKNVKSFSGRFRKGDAVGKALHYDQNGKLERKEITRFKKIKTTLYYPNGHKKMSGYAKMVDLLDRYQFYFYGRWKYYDSTGALYKYSYFNKGKMGKTIYLDKNNKTDDSLINALNTLDKKFFEQHASLINKINSSTEHPQISEKYRVALYQEDSAVFVAMGTYLRLHGYPSAKVAGESSLIPFSIMSYAPVPIKEKYVDLFRDAVKAGELKGKTYAFYVDKLKVAKQEKQIYGTQFYFDTKKLSSVYYPSEDPDNLKQRRAEMGFVEED